MNFRVTPAPDYFNYLYEIRGYWDVPHGDTECIGSLPVTGRGFLESVNACQITEADNGRIIKPFLTVTQQQAQQLMDALWDAGIRPSNGEGAVGQIGAVKEHLADMRRYSDSLLAWMLKDKPERYGKK